MNFGKADVKIIIGALGIVLATTGLAASAEYYVGSRWLKSADANKDKRISREEADGLELRRFSRLDHNGDQTVTAEEIDLYLAERNARRRDRILRRLDADKDRSVTRAEIDARTANLFRTLDPDGDGGITEDEVRSYREARRARRRAGQSQATQN